MIYILELEPLKERYTYWWKDYIPKQITKNKKCHVISGEALTDKVETGTVLDAASTNYWKSSQLKQISQMFYEGKIKPGDDFLVCDIWFPGIEMLRYMEQLYNIPIKIWGVWHAGSSTMNDFVEPMHHWSRFFEIGFLNICNGIFVGSDYSKKSIIDRLLYMLPQSQTEEIASRIFPYGMPLDYNYLTKYTTKNKKKQIIFPHRPDEEKNVHIWIALIGDLFARTDWFKDYNFVFSTSKEKYQSTSKWINGLLYSSMKNFDNIVICENLSKEQYYKLLAESEVMISTTSEENFGYCAVEALAVGTKVLLPNSFSHPEIVEENNMFLYNNYDEIEPKLTKLLSTKIVNYELSKMVEPYEGVVRKWLEIMS